MELKDFVAETLKQIVDGVQEAQGYAASKGAYINPKRMYVDVHGNLSVSERDTKGPMPHKIDFDVAVTVSEGGQAKSGIGVVAAIIAAGTQAQIESANMQVSRIKFVIPVVLPHQDIPFLQ